MNLEGQVFSNYQGKKKYKGEIAFCLRVNLWTSCDNDFKKCAVNFPYLKKCFKKSLKNTMIRFDEEL